MTFAEQAKSINAQIQNLKKAIIAHKKRALVEDKPTNDFVKPIIKMLASLWHWFFIKTVKIVECFAVFMKISKNDKVQKYTCT